MLSADRVVNKSLQQSYAVRNGLSGDFRSVIAQQGSSTEMAWLVAKGASAASKNLSEAWDSYLTSKGFTTGPLKDRMKAFFTTGTQA